MLAANNLNGTLPPELGTLTALESIDLSQNNLTGTIPKEFGQLSELKSLSFGYNALSGPLPEELYDLTNLEVLNVGHNSHSDTLSARIGNLTKLRSLHLFENALSGKIPSKLGACTQLMALTLNGNALCGDIPGSISNLTNLASDSASTDFGYNMLSSSDADIRSYLSVKDPDWEQTQTLPPTQVAASTLSDTSIRISWSPIPYREDDGFYTIFYGTISGQYSDSSRTDTKMDSTIDITGRNPGTKYFFTVSASTPAHGNQQNDLHSANSDEVSATTDALLAPTLQTLAASSVSGTAAVLNGIVNPNRLLTSVLFEYGLTTSYDSTREATQSPLSGAMSTAVSTVISGLLPNTVYHYRISATNAAGTSTGLDQTFTTSALPPDAITVAATEISRTSAVLNGFVNANGLRTVAHFDYGLTISYGSQIYAAPSPVDGNGNVAVSGQITGLLPDTTYHFRVVAVNDSGSKAGNDLAFITGSNSSPETPVSSYPASDTYFNSALPQLIWTVPEDTEGDALHFKVEVARDSNFTDPIANSPFESRNSLLGFGISLPATAGSGTCSFTVQNPLSDGSYYWRVLAFDGNTYSSPSIVNQFIVDTSAPSTSAHVPAKNAENVAVSTPVSIHVLDAGSGVALSSIRLQINGVAVTPVISGSAAECTVTYTPTTVFAFSQIVSVTVQAKDNAGNSMAAETYSFKTQAKSNSAPDRPVASLPADASYTKAAKPALTWSVPSDPEDEALHFKVEIAADSNFTAPVTGSPFESRINTVGFDPIPPRPAGRDSCSYTLQTALVDGNYYWRVSAWDGAYYGDASDIRNFSVDLTSPVIVETHVDSAISGKKLTVFADITDIGKIGSVVINFRQGGSTAFKTIVMNDNGGNSFSALIDANQISERGWEYYILASDKAGNSCTFPVSTPETKPLFVPVKVVDFARTEKTPAMYYRLISIPLQLEKTSPHDVLETRWGNYDNAQWRLLHYTQQKMQEFKLDNDFQSIQPGRGFWLITREAKTLHAGAAQSITTSQNFTITLHAGWNQIGNPFAFPVKWSDVIKNGLIEDRLVSYEGTDNTLAGYRYYQTLLLPWEGYFVKNHSSSDVFIEIPPKAADASLQKAGSDALVFDNLAPEEWMAQITATCGSHQDVDNYIGCLQSAADRWDKNDFSEAPFFEGEIALFFPHEDWADCPGLYSGDFHALKGQGGEWDFSVRTSSSHAKVELSFATSKNIPEEWPITLLDKSSHVLIDFKEQKSYVFPAGNCVNTRDFKLIVGEQSHNYSGYADINRLTQYELLQNYPNPFNQQTVVQYIIPETAPVHLAVYNLRGQVIRTLVNATQSIGQYTVIWDGKDDGHQPVTSSVYFLYFESGSQKVAKKMIVSK